MKIRYIMLAAVLSLASCAKDEMPQSVNPSCDNSSQDDFVDGWVRIKLERDAEPLKVGIFTRGAVMSGNSELDRLAEKLGATEIRRVFKDGGKFAERRRKAGLHLWYDIRIDENMPVSRAQSEVGRIPGVKHSQPIYRVRKADTFTAVPAEYVFSPAAVRPVLSPAELPVNDPEFNKQWHYYNDGSIPGSIEGADVNLLEAWKKFTAGDRAVIVADIDDGFDVMHEDLLANLWVNEGEIPGNGIDDDNNGYIDDINGYNYLDDSGTITPASGHGTHTGGTIAAVNNNGIGVCGIAGGTGNNDGVRLMCIQFNPGSVDCRYLDAFAYAADNGAVLTSNSWVLSMDGTPEDAGDAIDYFNTYAGMDENDNQTGPMKGGLNIFAAGNYNGSGSQYVGKAFYPAADPRVIGVAAMMVDYVKSPYSQYGQGVDVIAPGGENTAEMGQRIYSTLPGGYGYVCGTSMATPHVTGVAALIVSQYGTKAAGFTAEELRRRLIGSCRDIGSYQQAAWRNGIGAGLVDAAAMDVDERNPSAKPQWNGEPVIEGINDGLTISCKVPADGNGDPVSWLFIDITRKDGSGKPSNLRYGLNSKVGETFSLTLTAVGDKAYNIEMYLQDRFGNKSDKFITEVESQPHINRPPQIKNMISDIAISKVDASLVRTLDLSGYFRDVDIAEFGDELTYSVAENSDNKIAQLSIEGTSLKVVPLSSGSANIVVRATDKAGDFVEGSFKVSVLFKPFADIEINGTGKNDIVTLGMEGNIYSPLGNTYTIKATSSDTRIVTVLFDKAKNAVVVTPVAKGEATVTLGFKGSTQAVNPFESSFVVKVTDESPGEEVPVEGVSVYPNPAENFINLSVAGTSAGESVEIKIYDGASRLVKSEKGVMDSKSTARFDVSGLAAGIYTVKASSGGKNYIKTFVKR